MLHCTQLNFLATCKICSITQQVSQRSLLLKVSERTALTISMSADLMEMLPCVCKFWEPNWVTDAGKPLKFSDPCQGCCNCIQLIWTKKCFQWHAKHHFHAIHPPPPNQISCERPSMALCHHHAVNFGSYSKGVALGLPNWSSCCSVCVTTLIS